MPRSMSARRAASAPSGSGISSAVRIRPGWSRPGTARGDHGGKGVCMTPTLPVRIEVNGRWHEREVEPRRTLADFLREDLGLKGTHLACEHGFCGNCNVLLDGVNVRSCLMFA